MKKILTTTLLLFFVQGAGAADTKQETITVTLDVPAKISTFTVDKTITLQEDVKNSQFNAEGKIKINSNAEVTLSVGAVGGGTIEMELQSDKAQKKPLKINLIEENNADMVTAGATGVKLASLKRGTDKDYTLKFAVDGKAGETQPGTWSTELNVIVNAV